MRFITIARRFVPTQDLDLSVMLQSRRDKAADLGWVHEQIDAFSEIQRSTIEQSLAPHGATTLLAGGDKRTCANLYKRKSRAMMEVRRKLLRTAKELGVKIRGATTPSTSSARTAGNV